MKSKMVAGTTGTPTGNDNARRVRKIYEAFGRGDIAGVLDGLSEDIHWHVPGSKRIPYAGRRRGRQEVAQFFKTLAETTEINPFEPRDFICQGDKVAVTGYYAGQVKKTGRRFEEEWVMVWTFKDGKAVEFREYMDPTALETAFTAAAATTTSLS